MQLPLIGKVQKPTRWVVGLVAAGLLGTATTAYWVSRQAAPPADVTNLTVPVKSQDLTVRITASGSVIPVQTVNLSPKAAGRLAEVYVKQGDRVANGQVVARMDNDDVQAQLLQARASLEQAQARLAQTRSGSRPEEVAQAQARLDQAQARLSQTRAGSRSEEVAQARAQVEAAQARVNLTRERVTRYRGLAQEGAIAQDRLDEVITDDQSARASLKEAQRRLELVQNGSRPQEITQAEAQVAEARQALEQLQNGSRPEEIAQAVAEVKAAQGKLQAVQIQQEDTLIRAPFAGIVTQRYADPGAFVTPTTSASTSSSATSTSIVAIANGLEVLAKVPEVDINQIRLQQPVEIVADAFPDQVFKGHVRLIAPAAVEEQNVTSFQVKVALDTGTNKLQSGMNVNLTFLGNKLKQALVVPTVAIVTKKGETGVLVPNQDNKPEFRSVTIGPTVGTQTQVLDGVETGDRIFVDLPKGQKLEDITKTDQTETK